MKYFPILVPVKANSKRCHNKNQKLLPFLYNCFQKYQSKTSCAVLDQTVILCDCEEIATCALQCGFKNIWIEPYTKKYIKTKDSVIVETVQSVCKTEYESMWQWKLFYDSMTDKEKTKKYSCEFDTSWMFLSPATQPIKHFLFYKEIYQTSAYFRDNKDNIEFNVIASAQERVNRQLFDIHIDEDDKQNDFNSSVKNMYFLTSSTGVKTRRGVDCNSDINIDGTWYFFKSDLLEKLQDKQSQEQNQLFWSSGMKCIVCNNQPFIDIDNEADLFKLEYLKEMI